MAEALIGGLLAAGACEPVAICATDPVAARRDALKSRFGIRVGDENAKAVREADVVVLAVKPQAMPAVLGGESNRLSTALRSMSWSVRRRWWGWARRRRAGA